MSILETMLVALLALWTLASVACCLRRPRWPAFARWNRQFRVCSSWRVFSPGDDEDRSGLLELDYRERSDRGEPSPWTTVRDTCWSWHAFLAMPERRVANRVYHLIRELAGDLPAGGALPLSARRLAQFLGRRVPLGAGQVREFRLVVRPGPGGEVAETVCSFCVGPDGNPR